MAVSHSHLDHILDVRAAIRAIVKFALAAKPVRHYFSLRFLFLDSRMALRSLLAMDGHLQTRLFRLARLLQEAHF